MTTQPSSPTAGSPTTQLTAGTLQSDGKPNATAKATVADLEAKLATAKQTLEEAKKRFDDAYRWEERLTELESSMLPVAAALPGIEPLEKAEAEALDRLQNAEEIRIAPQDVYGRGQRRQWKESKGSSQQH